MANAWQNVRLDCEAHKMWAEAMGINCPGQRNEHGMLEFQEDW